VASTLSKIFHSALADAKARVVGKSVPTRNKVSRPDWIDRSRRKPSLKRSYLNYPFFFNSPAHPIIAIGPDAAIFPSIKSSEKRGELFGCTIGIKPKSCVNGKTV
jgi:hypothetical protein